MTAVAVSKFIMSHIRDLATKMYGLTWLPCAVRVMSKSTTFTTDHNRKEVSQMTPAEKAVKTREENRLKREAKSQYHRELLEVMIMNLEIILRDETVPNDSRLRAVELINELRKELHV